MAVADVLGRGGLVVGHHRQSCRHCFKHHVAKGFSQAREQENIPGGVMFGQGFTTLGSAEQGLRQLLLQSAALGAITDHNQFDTALWIVFSCCVQAVLQHA
ncbi:hypothetical protein D3C77_696000 [compost metagenome]